MVSVVSPKVSSPKVLPQSVQLTTIQGEPAVPLEYMPDSWQRIAKGQWMQEPKVYTAMAQVFLAKQQQGHTLFGERKSAAHLKAAYCEGNGQLAYEAVAHYGKAFLPEAYPNLSAIREEVMANSGTNLQAGQEKLALVSLVSDLFDELTYDVPSTFYWTFLHPLERSNLFEIRSFRFSEQDLGVARQFDAILHGGYVSMLRRLIDSVSSKYGYFIEHGCGCESHLAKLKPCDSPFDYVLPAESRQKTLRAFFWSVMEEYLFFEQRAATKLVYADRFDFE